MIPTMQLASATADVLGLALEYPAGAETSHVHEQFGQIMYIVRGAATVQTEQGCWVLPPQRALWIPAGVRHAFSHARPVSLRTVYVRRGCAGMPDWRQCTVIHVAALLRELMLALMDMPWNYASDSHADRIGKVLLDSLAAAEQDALDLRTPNDPRAARAALIARGDPAHTLPLSEIAHRAGASERTLNRLFIAETSMGFGAWRRCLRLTHALESLAYGEPVATVAAAIGYENPSSFIAAFKSVFGTTPAKYFSSSSSR